MKRSIRISSVSAMLAILLAGAVQAADYDVTQINTTFNPANLIIQAGDTVNWIWTSLDHTVTNGFGPADPDVGTLFDDPLNAANPTFSYTFNVVGTYPYFCRPHFTMGMTGTITVEPVVGVEAATWSNVKNLFD
ncbi:MAG TPA: plastocyanin/azurin family copper-binding protein [Candidatus Krumholzibacteria bacterium]|nr:plastocyanin/azurin family copper-binding protein [Candidatus Krumholzibacteria bacterium]HPD70877.1 plastocyanin/azurin family copper-binding protein [Candidatus Krumholzibacteria bacterium]HRY39423.1 plastocyanin/azurin family copper-binding protein [Candidatus Krumholzibacteria bacterium]